MALIDELKEMRESAKKRELERRAEAFEMQTWADVDAKYVRELDTAIAALTPAPAPVEIEDSIAPEGMPECAWETVTLTEAAPADEQDDASEFAQPMPDAEFVALDEQTCEPLDTDLAQILHDNMDKLLITDEAPALNEAMQDEREEPVALAQPEWNEPQPTEGYAPVTNPEADALARAHDYYDPKAVADRERNAGLAKLFSYNPFYKPKVEA